jgi:hypothetical protein
LSARARAADAGQILETLCAVREERRGPSSAKATAGQANAEGKFLPWCFNSKPLAVRGLAAKKHKKRERRPTSHPFCILRASLRQALEGALGVFYGYRKVPGWYQGFPTDHPEGGGMGGLHSCYLW